MAGEGSGSGGNRRFLTAVRRLIIKAQRKGKDDSAGKEEMDPSTALAEEIRRGPRGRRSQQLEAGMASPVSQNSSPNTGRRKEAAAKLGLGWVYSVSQKNLPLVVLFKWDHHSCGAMSNASHFGWSGSVSKFRMFWFFWFFFVLLTKSKAQPEKNFYNDLGLDDLA